RLYLTHYHLNLRKQIQQQTAPKRQTQNVSFTFPRYISQPMDTQHESKFGNRQCFTNRANYRGLSVSVLILAAIYNLSPFYLLTAGSPCTALQPLNLPTTLQR